MPVFGRGGEGDRGQGRVEVEKMGVAVKEGFFGWFGGGVRLVIGVRGVRRASVSACETGGRALEDPSRAGWAAEMQLMRGVSGVVTTTWLRLDDSLMLLKV